jgi:hypothetical protein
LKVLGLSRPETRFNPKTHSQTSTRYIVRFEDGFIPEKAEPCAESGSGISGSGTEEEYAGEPCPDLGKSRVQIWAKAVSRIRTLTL